MKLSKPVKPVAAHRLKRDAEKGKRMERVLKSMVRTWDAGHHREDPAGTEDWIGHVVSRAKSILRNYGSDG